MSCLPGSGLMFIDRKSLTCGYESMTFQVLNLENETITSPNSQFNINIQMSCILILNTILTLPDKTGSMNDSTPHRINSERTFALV
jgi:hypothetical protein